MQRYAIIDTTTNLVENCVDFESAPSNPPPGFSDSHIAVASATANPGDGWNGTSIVPKSVPVAPPAPTLGQKLSPSDYQLARAAEELIPLLLSKGVIAHTDLSASVITNINVRRLARGLTTI